MNGLMGEQGGLTETPDKDLGGGVLIPQSNLMVIHLLCCQCLKM